jgi:hypothetical protein
MTKQDVIDFINLMLTRPLTALSRLKDVLLYIVDFITSSTSDSFPDWTGTQTFKLDGSLDGKYCKYPDSNGKVRLFETKIDNNTNHLPPTDPDLTENTYWKEVSPSSGSAIKEWAPGVYGNGFIIVYYNHSNPKYGPGFYLLQEATRPFNSTDIEAELVTGKWLRIPQIKPGNYDAWDATIAAGTGYANGDTVRYTDNQIYHSNADGNTNLPDASDENGVVSHWVLDSRTEQPDLDSLFTAGAGPDVLTSAATISWNLDSRYRIFGEVSTGLTAITLKLLNFKKGTNCVLFLDKTNTADLVLTLQATGYAFKNGNDTITTITIHGSTGIYAIQFDNLSQAGAIAGIYTRLFNPSRPSSSVVADKTAHGFAVKDLLTINGAGAFVKCSSNTDDIAGIVKLVNSANKFTFQQAGMVEGLSGLSAGSDYYHQADGSLGTTTTAKKVGKAISATELFLFASGGGGVSLTDALSFKGVIDCSANPNYPAADAGDVYKISVAGKIGGSSGTNVEAGDILLCTSDATSSGNQATVGTYWSIQQTNIDGAVTGPASSTSGNIVTFSGTSGKVIQDASVAVSALLRVSNNLSDLASASTARTNLGLGTLATQSGTFSGTSSGTNTGDQTITLTGDVTGSGTGSFATTIGAGKVTNTMLAGSIAYSKLSLTGAVVDGDLATSYIKADGTRALTGDWYNTQNASFSAIGVGTGSTAPTGKLHVVETLSSSPRGIISDQYNTAGNSAQLHLRKARGTFATPTAVVTGDIISNLSSWGYDGSAFINNASVRVTSTGTIATGAVPTKMEFMTSNASGTLSAGVSIDQNQNVIFTQGVQSASSPSFVTFTAAAHTGLTAGAEAVDININLARTVQFTNGSIATQRAILIQAPTYAFTSASTIATAVTLSISGAPVAGTNMTFTDSYSFRTEAGRVLFTAGGGSTTKANVTIADSSSSSKMLLDIKKSNSVFSIFQEGRTVWTNATLTMSANTGFVEFSGTNTLTYGYATPGDTGHFIKLSPTIALQASYSSAEVAYFMRMNFSIAFATSATPMRGVDYDPTITGTIGDHTAWRHTKGYVAWQSVVSPVQITANQNDYNPTGWVSGGNPHGASVLRVNTDASRNITSLAGGIDGRIAVIVNVGSFDIILKNDDGATGTAANRFALSADVTIAGKEARIIMYDGTSNRWRLMGKV